MKNIFLLPTDKPSKLFLSKRKNQLFINEEFDDSSPKVIAHHIYITSDEEIKDGDYAVYLFGESVQKIQIGVNFTNQKAHRKIILTTDQDLIKDGVQAIDDEFLEWFVKNPSCEEVVVERETAIGYAEDRQRTFYGKYKILIPKITQEIIDENFAGGLDIGQIIPKEEIDRMNSQLSDSFAYKCRVIPKEEHKQNNLNHFFSTSNVIVKNPQKFDYKNIVLPKELSEQKTLEEAKQIILDSNYVTKNDADIFEMGVKWQAEQNSILYSEEEVKSMINELVRDCYFMQEPNQNVNAWFEQFKKK